MHCTTVETRAESIQAKYSGFSVSALQNKYYFANSTPSFSPPALSTSTPTHVLTTVVKYMEFYKKQRRLQDPLPSSWVIPKPIISPANLIPVPKEAIHFFDGDSPEIRLGENSPAEMVGLATHGNTIRLRMKDHDAPETKFAVRFYRQSQGSVAVQSLLTRHLGLESLRVIRQIVYESLTVFIEAEKDAEGNMAVPLDNYRRRLVNIYVEMEGGAMLNLAEVLAARGFTYSYYSTGINDAINNAMRLAITNKLGMFNLPQDVFCYPYRPWDLRANWPHRSRTAPPAYQEYKEILDVPDVPPEQQWRISESATDDDDELTQSQSGDTFLFRFVVSSMREETLCFVASSTIPGAGQGLFLREHGYVIKRDTHLCLYAATSTTEEEMASRNSSRDYAISLTSHPNVWFDAEVPDGSNLGRYANSPAILEVMGKVRDASKKACFPHFFEADWKKFDDEVKGNCNAAFKVVSEQMTLCAACDLPPSDQPKELFVNYGGLRNYWINAITKHPERFPQSLTSIVQWLLNSDECNWTQEQRLKWSNM